MFFSQNVSLHSFQTNKIDNYETDCKNISIEPNSTLTNFSRATIHDDWSDTFYAYTGIFLPIFLLFSILSSYRSLTPFSVIGVAAIGSASIHVISYFIGVGNDYKECLDDANHLDMVYIFESASPQIGLLVCLGMNWGPVLSNVVCIRAL